MEKICFALAIALLSGCATFGDAEWCVSKGKIVVTIPTDKLPRKEDCKVKELIRRIL